MSLNRLSRYSTSSFHERCGNGCRTVVNRVQQRQHNEPNAAGRAKCSHHRRRCLQERPRSSPAPAPGATSQTTKTWIRAPSSVRGFASRMLTWSLGYLKHARVYFTRRAARPTEEASSSIRGAAVSSAVVPQVLMTSLVA